jgi:putative FmdB family regulatory protein
MPIYEYQCLECNAEFQKLILKQEEEKGLSCPKCHNQKIKRLVSRVAFHMSEGERLASFDANTRKPDSFYSDTRNIGLSAMKRAKEFGVDLGDGFKSKLEKLRTDPGSVLDSND